MKFLRVNMTDKSIDTQEVPKEYAGLGGRGLTSNLINNEVPAACDALGPDSKLVFAPGFLSGTPLINTAPPRFKRRTLTAVPAAEPSPTSAVTWDSARTGSAP